MTPKITLTANGIERACAPEDLKNWADVMCSYVRSDYGGVIRKFTSQFDFVGETRSFLLDLYLRYGVESECCLAVYTMTERWEYVKAFECPLDFSSVQWDDYVFSVSSIDSSLSALIKAEKNTKYELLVGEDIEADSTFHFDRLPMQESATYAFTQGESDEDTGAISVHMDNGDLPWLGNIASEISVGKAVLYKDDQDVSDGGYLIQAYADLDVTLSWSVDIDTLKGSGAGITPRAEVLRGAGVSYSSDFVDKSNKTLVLGGGYAQACLGVYSEPSALPEPAYGTADVGKWALVGTVVWVVSYNGRFGYWDNTGKTEKEYFRTVHEGSMTLSLETGDKVRIVANWESQAIGYTNFTLNSSSFKLSWKAKGDMCDIPSFSPKTVGDAILRKIAGHKYNAVVSLSYNDMRIARTRLMAAESIRGIDGAKFYSSFGEYCDWMETVFGYTYWIGEPQSNPLARVAEVGTFLYTSCTYERSKFVGEIDPENIVYVYPLGMFLYYSPDDGKYYSAFDGSEQYMDDTNRPLADVVYIFANRGAIYFSGSTPTVYPYDTEEVGKDIVTVHFVHRSELFSGNVSKEIEHVRDLKYKVNASVIYSAITIGYDKKDYDSINGRDEFNFNTTYSTGSAIAEKKLTMQSKYRADCYGMEFAAQKRGEETTDTDSDQDVFFVYCRNDKTDSYPDRTAVLGNVLSSDVFNGEFSPLACVRANAGYLGMQSEGLTLRFASSTGNSSVTIDGEPIGSDIELGSSMLTCGEVEFETDDQEVTANLNDAVRIESNGIEYVGYIADLDLMYFRQGAAKYKIIVKSVNSI